LGTGVSVEFGLAYNLEEFEVGPYFTLERTYGADASIGFIHNKFSPLKGTGDLFLSDLRGKGQSINFGLGPFDATFGGTDEGQINIGPNKYYHGGLGGSAGSPVGVTINKGKTWIFIINQAN
jgi:hypothetical protein